MAMRKPSPSSPSRLSAGMRHESKNTSPVVEPLMPIFGSMRPTEKPGRSASTTKAEMPECPAAGVGLREHGVEPGHARVGDEALRAVEDVLVAVPPRLRAHRRRVGARARLGQRVRGQPLARGQLGQEARLLLVRRRQLDRQRAELLHGEDEAARGAHLRDLLDGDERHQRAGAEAAVLLVEHDPEEVVLAVAARRRPTGTPTDLSISCARGAMRSRARSRTSSRISRCSSVSGSSGTFRSYSWLCSWPPGVGCSGTTTTDGAERCAGPWKTASTLFPSGSRT